MHWYCVCFDSFVNVSENYSKEICGKHCFICRKNISWVLLFLNWCERYQKRALAFQISINSHSSTFIFSQSHTLYKICSLNGNRCKNTNCLVGTKDVIDINNKWFKENSQHMKLYQQQKSSNSKHTIESLAFITMLSIQRMRTQMENNNVMLESPMWYTISEPILLLIYLKWQQNSNKTATLNIFRWQWVVQQTKSMENGKKAVQLIIIALIERLSRIHIEFSLNCWKNCSAIGLVPHVLAVASTFNQLISNHPVSTI